MKREYVGYRIGMNTGLFNTGLTGEEVVRCRDCAHSWWGGTRCGYFNEYNPLSHDVDVPAKVEPDGFCKWGERKENL